MAEALAAVSGGSEPKIDRAVGSANLNRCLFFAVEDIDRKARKPTLSADLRPFRVAIQPDMAPGTSGNEEEGGVV